MDPNNKYFESYLYEEINSNPLINSQLITLYTKQLICENHNDIKNRCVICQYNVNQTEITRINGCSHTNIYYIYNHQIITH